MSVTLHDLKTYPYNGGNNFKLYVVAGMCVEKERKTERKLRFYSGHNKQYNNGYLLTAQAERNIRIQFQYIILGT